MNRKPVLIIHPDADFRDRIARFLSELNCPSDVGGGGDIRSERVNVSDYRLAVVHEDEVLPDGQKVYQHVLNGTAAIPVVIVSDEINVRKAVKAIQIGAHDYFTKESEPQAIQMCLKEALRLTAQAGSRDRGTAQSAEHGAIITQSDKMVGLLSIAKRVAGSSATILVEGESGTGKELLARFIHRHSGRAEKPFVAMNCAALPESLAESELFGYGKGAFTGATKNRIGKFEQAHEGTLVLDEISEMPLALQVKLLRVLQEREVDPIGGHTPIPVDVRVVATCNRELSQMVQDGTFRQDLYYRLRVIPLKIPALRERTDDIPLLVDHFIAKFKKLHRTPDLSISPEAMAKLTGWPWPGNVRELENTIERATLICESDMIQPEHLLIEDELSLQDASASEQLVGMTVKQIERKLINQTLQHVNENRTHAAEMLGISIRTLRNKLREYAHT